MNIVRGIRSSMNRFLSILFIVALGTGFMAGLDAASPDMYETADRYLDDCRWYDLDVRSYVGFSEADADAIRRLPCVETLQPVNLLDAVLRDGSNTAYTARIYGMLGPDGATDLNRLTLTEGRFPENETECVIESVTGQYSSDVPQIGETLHLADAGAGSSALTVVGTVRGPMCISIIGDVTRVGTGTVSLNVYTTSSFFPSGSFTDLHVAVKGASTLNTFSEEYRRSVEDASEEILTRCRFSSDNLETLSEELDTKLGFFSALITLMKKVQGTALRLEDDVPQRAEQTGTVASLLAKAGAAALSGSLSRTAEGLLDVRKDGGLESTLRYAEATRTDLLQKRDSLDNVFSVRTRSDSPGFESYQSNVGKVAALSRIFPVFFFLVALLVALTTMTRLIEENRTQIGTLKALGFSNGQILTEYLFYSLLASFLGCLLGLPAGFRLFPRAIGAAYGMMYYLPAVQTSFRFSSALWIAPVTVSGILLATLWACWNEFRSCPAQLMQPRAPKTGKRILLERIPPLWNRLAFTQKVMLRNLFRYKKRFFMTVLGVAGCTALLLTGFGLRDSIGDIVDKQFGDIYRYELSVLTDSETAAETDASLRSLLNGGVIREYLPLHQTAVTLSFQEHTESIDLSVPRDAAAISSFITLRDRRSGRLLSLSGDGLILTEKFAESCGITVGDTVTLDDGAGRQAAFPVTGITENYLTSFAYLSPEGYRNAFGKAPACTVLLCRLPDGAEAGAVTEKVLECPHVLFARSSPELKKNFSDSIRAINGVILVLILSAGLLSVVVLYNLTNVNLCERRKELATLRVLGFHEREAERYVFRETVALSLIGSAVGLLIGKILHAFVIRTVEIDQVMFGRRITLLSYLAAVLISLLFTAIVNRIMRRQIRRVDMVEAMKAND